jgi:hypothetical protein
VRQKEVAASNHLSGIYTPKLVRNGRDWRDWWQPLRAIDFNTPARASIHLQQSDGSGAYEARVAPGIAGGAWTAYWTVTEHNYSSRVKAGENAGEFLKHDFVVKQYAPVGRYEGVQSLKFFASAAQVDHPRQINLIVSDVQTGAPLQAVSLQCT